MESVGIAAVTGLALGLLAVATFGREPSLERNLRDIGKASNDAWKQLRRGFEEALYELKDGFDKAVSQLR